MDIAYEPRITYHLEMGIYDDDPNHVRATIYESIFKVPPFSNFEVHDSLVNKEKITQWIVDNHYELFHCKLVHYHDDGEERWVRYYVNKKNKTLVMLRRTYIDPKTEPDILSSDDCPMDRERKKNPNKLAWFCLLAPSEEIIQTFKKTFDSFRLKEDTRNKIYMLKATEYGGLELDSFPTNGVDVALELNYGDAFLKAHEHITDNLKNKKSGLYVFHGPPGTGKTSYIKYLTTIVDRRKFIFVPNIMVAELFSPKMVDKLYSFKNSVLILEDAEICVFKRNGTNNELVSGILNITDGLLKDLLNISILVTFNAADISELDSALLRKGRLKVMHRFDILNHSDAVRLAEHLKKRKKVTSPLSLADVYNLDEETGVEEVTQKKVGFGFAK